MSDKFKDKFNLDQQNLARDALTSEERREACDRRPRFKFVHHGQSSRDVSPRFKVASDSIADTPYYQALEDLAKSAGRCMSMKKTLSHNKGTKALRTLSDPNQILAASLCNNLSIGTLRFRSDSLLPSSSKSKSNIEQLLLSNPNQAEIFRKVLNRRSGKQLFKPFKDKITKTTNNTCITEKGKSIRKNHVSIRIKK